MLRPVLSCAFGLWFALGCAGVAETESGVVVELYTSQGCSSCPPADQLMGELAEMPGVIALALHVDYWDYIGWSDTFANPHYTERQKAYAHAAGERMIYTPQMIVAGGQRVEGNQPGTVAAAIAASSQAPQLIDLDLRREDSQLHIRGESRVALPQGTTVQIVRYLDAADVTIDRGENAGLAMTYRNVVTSWQKIGEWTGSDPLDLTADLPGKDPVVVIVQAPGPAQILAAARLR